MAKPTLQGGVKNYLGSQRTVSNVPVKWKSGPDKPETELAYITEAEKDLLLKEDIHGSLSKGPNMGPGGLMSLDSWGDTGGGGSAGVDTSASGGASGDARTQYSPAPRVEPRTAPVHDFDVGPTISAGQSVAMIGNTSLAGSSPDYAQAVVDAGMLSDPADRVVDTGITLDTGDGTAMEEFYRVNPVLPPVEDFEDTEAQKIQDTQYMINKGLLQKDLATGEIVEGPNVRHPETLEVVPRSSIEPEVTTGGDEIPYVSPVTQTDVTPPEDTGLTEAENRALIDAYGYGKTVPVDIQDLGPREISPLADQRMQRDYAENVRLMAEPRTLSAQGGRIGYYDGELVEDDDEEETIRAQALASLPEYQLFSQRRKAMLGGRMGYNQGGIARQPFFVGKLVKAVTKPLKKIVKSPVGKLALLGGLGAWGLGAGPFANLPGQGFLKGNFMKKMLLNKAKEGGWEATKWKLANVAPWKATAGITSIASIPLWAKPTNWDEMDEAEQDAWLKDYQSKVASYKKEYGEDIPVGLTSAANMPYQLAAQGGRIGAQEGGLMDLGGMEKDYRQEGGFVPIGGEEKADDVPARLSKNEFVFTADAVRAAGGGDIDEGAAGMERLMENLEAGGKVSEESQGLEGAQEMFANTQRLQNRII